ncbi:PREDICTED: transcription factor bHLH68-like isoform X2 [Ipomoea nil]|uniref:transcription factor bHLH68-like isoform X2 n=1 Tax=Ipomoea nil TaxID=35883 RepID=UPI0009010F3B|nr:PREDICTED: transcription factor bHLH68-like isoform X2 [Ipomoea nil]
MNRGVLQSSSLPVQQMMGGGSPNWWSIINNTMRPPLPHHQLHHHHHQPPPPPPFLAPLPTLFPSPPPPTATPSLPPLSASSWTDNNHHEHQLPESWSQLLLGGLVGEEDKSGFSGMQQLLSHASASAAAMVYDVKQENPTNTYVYGGGHGGNVEFPAKSCVTSLSSNNMLDFSNKSDARHPPPDHSSECNSTATGGAPTKKARIQPSSTQSTFKVRKEKLGDRITALHQLVSPFGKTDTASVLLEAIGYIRFLQSQIEALSLPYLGNGSGNNMRHQQQSFVQGAERNSLFPEDPGQLLNDNCLKRKGTSDHHQPQDGDEEAKKDLRSRGLCLVPISCTLQVGSDNGADYWAPAAFGGGGFRS